MNHMGNNQPQYPIPYPPGNLAGSAAEMNFGNNGYNNPGAQPPNYNQGYNQGYNNQGYNNQGYNSMNQAKVGM